ncbi:Translation initiation factor 2 subunit alpha [Candidatus Norongarragalina meridionalis]|nr:Translation initiation factor 2 subunit alpha [Candidatus Norongarragalina meridionalis]
MPTPQLNELVIATVKRIFPYGAVISLDEYPTADAFIHISEVSSGWCRNVSEHLKMGQKVVAKIIRLEPEKNQIDASIKRVSEGERKKKLQDYKSAKRGTKLFERAALKAGKTAAQAKDVEAALVAEYGTLYEAFEAIAEGAAFEKHGKPWASALEEVAKQEIKPKKVEVRATLNLQSYAADGIGELKKVLGEISKSGVTVHYVGAPQYYLTVTAGDYKTAEKALDAVETKLSAVKNIEYSMERAKK